MRACFPGTESRACGIVTQVYLFIFLQLSSQIKMRTYIGPLQLKIGLSIIKLIHAHFNCTCYLLCSSWKTRKLLCYTVGPFLGATISIHIITRTEVTQYHFGIITRFSEH